MSTTTIIHAVDAHGAVLRSWRKSGRSHEALRRIIAKLADETRDVPWARIQTVNHSPRITAVPQP